MRRAAASGMCVWPVLGLEQPRSSARASLLPPAVCSSLGAAHTALRDTHSGMGRMHQVGSRALPEYRPRASRAPVRGEGLVAGPAVHLLPCRRCSSGCCSSWSRCAPRRSRRTAALGGRSCCGTCCCRRRPSRRPPHQPWSRTWSSRPGAAASTGPGARPARRPLFIVWGRSAGCVTCTLAACAASVHLL